MERQFLASYNPHRRDGRLKHPPSLSGKKNYLFILELQHESRLLVWHTSRSLKRWFLRMEASGHQLGAFCLKHSSVPRLLQLLLRGQLYSIQFWWPESLRLVVT